MPNKLLYKNKYRIPSARLHGWDYRTSAPYFVTICTKNRAFIFGHIENGNMYLNQLGQFANECIENITTFSKAAFISNHVIMPNHVHAIIELNNDTYDYEPNSFGPLLAKSLSSVVNHYKGRVTKYALGNNLNSGWQARFHEHIIRDRAAYERIFNYITNNPQNWENDTFRKNP